MMNKIILIFFLFPFISGLALAQEKKESLNVSLVLVFDNQPLALNKKYISESKDTLSVAVFKFYISNIKLQFSDETTFFEPNSYHLIDVENPNSLQIKLKKIDDKLISRITFSIGVDSLASISGAMSGDLDATNGMYWAWQSGFINMKIQGASKSCSTRKNEYNFHIGGYLKPNNAIRTITLEPKNKNFNIKVDLAKLFSQIQLSEINSIMIPGKNAMDIADKSVKMFSIYE